MWPWRDQTGQFSFFRLAVLLALLAPGTVTAFGFALGRLGAQPLTEAIHETGLWAIRLLFVSLAVTPLRTVLDWPRLLDVRRMIGVAAFAYAFVHLFLYAADQSFALGKVVSEIALRIYLTIGFTALLGLAALAVTSTDRAVRRMGPRWRQLHRAAYVIGLLAAVHFFMQSKADVGEPIMMMGLFTWLMGYRALVKRKAKKGGRRARGLAWPWLAALSASAVAATALGEALWFWFKLGAPPLEVLATNVMADAGWRPAWGVALAVVLVLVGAALRRTTRVRWPWLHFGGGLKRPSGAV